MRDYLKASEHLLYVIVDLESAVAKSASSPLKSTACFFDYRLQKLFPLNHLLTHHWAEMRCLPPHAEPAPAGSPAGIFMGHSLCSLDDESKKSKEEK